MRNWKNRRVILRGMIGLALLVAGAIALLSRESDAGLFGSRSIACGPNGCGTTAAATYVTVPATTVQYQTPAPAYYQETHSISYGEVPARRRPFQNFHPFLRRQATAYAAGGCYGGMYQQPISYTVQATPQATPQYQTPIAPSKMLPIPRSPSKNDPLGDVPPVPTAPQANPAIVPQGSFGPRIDGNPRTILVTQKREVVAATVPAIQTAVASVPPTDPDGIVSRINYFRSLRGLRPLAYDHNLSTWAHYNNYGQLRSRYSSHHVNPNAHQIAFYSPRTADQAVQGWLASPSHASVIYNPNLTRMGAARDGLAWTANAQ